MFATGTPKSTHIIVIGNEKGGSGKSTTAMHVAVALMKAGHRVATIDLDSRQKSLTQYVANRERFMAARGVTLDVPTHQLIVRSRGDSVKSNTWADYEAFARAIAQVETSHDFIVIDSPGQDNALSRAAHSSADTLITPLNDSFVDLDVIARVDPLSLKVTGISHYAEMVHEALRERRAVDNCWTDWVVMRNRVSVLDTRNRRTLAQVLDVLAAELGFRLSPGIAERVIYRELFPLGLTAVDPFELAAPNGKPTSSHQSARDEVAELIELLRLPTDERLRRRLGARALWVEASTKPLDMGDVLAV